MNNRRPIVAGNWKMNKTVGEALTLVRELRGMVSMIRERVEIVIAPPFTALHAVARAIEESNIHLAAQNCYWDDAGAFTGEVSAPMLKEIGETDETVNRRVQAVLRNEMLPILCVGETLPEREAERTLEVVSRQLAGGLARFAASQVAHFVIAYEPVWAIGTGRNATSDQAQEVHAHIREQLTGAYGREVAEQVRIQYGGSVKPDNAAELMGKPDVDGALVGGASLKAGDFAAIVRARG
jgi:triosephosphate isomerase